jgi:hypothetical protein
MSFMVPALPVLVGAFGLGLILYQKFGGKMRRFGLTNTIYSSDSRGAMLGGIEQNPPATTIPWPPASLWQRLTIDGEDYFVSPTYLAPIGIGEAFEIAKANGLVVPTPRMVNAIWQAADLKLAPHPQAHDGTAKTMNARALTDKQNDYIAQQIDGREFNLLGGTHKDIVFVDTAFGKAVNKPGIYGWHKLDGSVIQQEMWGHSLDWKDYSQGLRLIRKA